MYVLLRVWKTHVKLLKPRDIGYGVIFISCKSSGVFYNNMG